jgi:hypothetical protein
METGNKDLTQAAIDLLIEGSEITAELLQYQATRFSSGSAVAQTRARAEQLLVKARSIREAASKLPLSDQTQDSL